MALYQPCKLYPSPRGFAANAVARWIALVFAFVLNVVLFPVQPQAQQSVSCASINGGAINGSLTGINGTSTLVVLLQLNVNDAVSVSMTAGSTLSGGTTSRVRLISVPAGATTATIIGSQAPPASGSFTATVAGIYQVEYQIDVAFNESRQTINFSVNCSPGSQPDRGMITIVKKTIGGEGTASFSSTDTDLDGLALMTVGGTASSVNIIKSAGTYTVTEGVVDGFELVDINCNDPDGGTITNLATRTVAIDLDVGEHITCTFTNQATSERSSSRIRAFLYRRADLLLDIEPDRPRLVRRTPSSLWRGAPGISFADRGTSRLALDMGLDRAKRKFSFSTSLRQLAKSRTTRLDKALGAFLKDAGSKTLPGGGQDGWDLWVEGHFINFTADTAGWNHHGHLGVLFVGADLYVSPTMLFGVLGQLDWLDDNAETLLDRVDGRGWMVGPYLSVKLQQQLFFDVRAAWGMSDNDLFVAPGKADKFDTDRWLVNARLTGNWRYGNFRTTPSLTLKYFKDGQLGFVSTLGTRISEQSVTIGRFTFGPEFSYRHVMGSGAVIEPHVSIKGIWDFAGSDRLATPDARSVEVSGIRAKVEAGILAVRTDGISLRATASYDGIGTNDLEAIGGHVWFNVPLN